MEFLKGKPKGTNPDIMGNPINMYGVNDSTNNQFYTKEIKANLSETMHNTINKLHVSLVKNLLHVT